MEQSGDPDQTLCPVESDLGIHCLPTSHKKVARLIWIKQYRTEIAYLSEQTAYLRNKS